MTAVAMPQRRPHNLNGRRPMRPVPSDFRELAPVKPNNFLIAHYRTNHNAVARWRRETGIKAPGRIAPNKLAMPRDFSERVSQMKIADVAQSYGCGRRTVCRWLKEAGISLAAKPRPKPAPTGYRKLPASQKRAYAWSLPTVRPCDGSSEGRAADFLRRFAPVYRCDESGRMTERGSRWRYGNAVLEPTELVARARGKGFDPDAWSRL